MLEILQNTGQTSDKCILVKQEYEVMSVHYEYRAYKYNEQ
jgi:hypothetical protein